MNRSRFVLAALVATGCSFLPAGQGSAPSPAPAPSPTTADKAPVRAPITRSSSLVKAMYDRYDGKYLKTMSFLQNNTAYTTTGEEQRSQWYEHLEVPGKLRIAFLPATQRSGLVQVDDRVASFDNGIRVDFRKSINPQLLLTADVFASSLQTIMERLDSLGVDTDITRTDEWEGRPVYVVGAKSGDTTSNQMWVDRDQLLLVRFIQNDRSGGRTTVSDIRVRNYREIEGFQIPTEFLVVRNGRPAWREQYDNIRINEAFPPGVFDQARWNDIPLPK